MSTLTKNLKVLSHRLTPKYLLTRLAGFLAARDLGKTTTFFINVFINKYKINMSEANQENPASYHTFNDFFTRTLKPGMRPIDENEASIVIPVDGTMAEFVKLNSTV